MKEYVGIIVKTYLPQKYKLAILDKELGKIVCVPHREDIRCGTLISYHLSQQKNVYFIQNITIIDMPLSLAQYNLIFLHHVLEICYYFIPVGSNVPEIFDLLSYILIVPHITSPC